MARGRVGKWLQDDLTPLIVGRVEYDEQRSRFVTIRFNEGQDASALQVDDCVEIYPEREGSMVRIFSRTISNIETDGPNGELTYSYQKSRF